MTREAPVLGLYGNVGQIYHSGLTVQFSYLPRAACRYPKPSIPDSRRVMGVGWIAGRAKLQIEDLQTRRRCYRRTPPSHPPFTPQQTPILLHPNCGSDRMTNCPAKRSKIRDSENTWIEVLIVFFFSRKTFSCLNLPISDGLQSELTRLEFSGGSRGKPSYPLFVEAQWSTTTNDFAGRVAQW